MFNPDAPNDAAMKLYKCWDSSVVITDDEHARLVIRERNAQLDANAIMRGAGPSSSGEGGGPERKNNQPKKEKTIAQQAKAAPIPIANYIHIQSSCCTVMRE